MRRGLIIVLLAALPRAALACPVCFGQSDSPMASGINYGIFVMLGIIAVLWVAFGSFFIYLWRRSRLAEGPANQPPPRLRRSAEALRAKAEAGPHVHSGPHAQEGTV